MNMRKQEAGQSAVEYLLLMALMFVIAVTIMGEIRGKFQKFARGLAYRVAQPCAACEEKEIPKPE